MTEISQTNILGSGYFGPANIESKLVMKANNLAMYIATFKHALLFNPKLVLTDEMLLTENFKAAYLSDPEFRKLFRADLISVAHNDRIFGGRALTFVESRRFHNWLDHGQAKQFHPFEGSSLFDEFDVHLEAIQCNVERLYPNSFERDPIYTAFFDKIFENEVSKDFFGQHYSLIDAAYLELRARLREKKHVLGIVHIDENHRLHGTENIFDVMQAGSSLLCVPRQELVRRYARPLSQISRTLMIRSELRLLSNTHAILPNDLKPVRTLTFSEMDEMSIEQREAEVRMEKLDLQMISVSNMSTLTLDEILEMRKAAQPFFQSVREGYDDAASFDEIWRQAGKYCRHLNHKLGFRNKATTSSRINSRIRLVQGELDKRKGVIHGGIAMFFEVTANLSSTLATVALGNPAAGAAVKIPLKFAEESAKNIVAPTDLERVVEDVKSSFIVAGVNDRQCMLSYE